MKEALGKWLMDIAKYLATAILLSSFFSDLSDITLLIWAVIATVTCLVGGLVVINHSEKVNKKKDKKKRR